MLKRDGLVGTKLAPLPSHLPTPPAYAIAWQLMPGGTEGRFPRTETASSTSPDRHDGQVGTRSAIDERDMSVSGWWKETRHFRRPRRVGLPEPRVFLRRWQLVAVSCNAHQVRRSEGYPCPAAGGRHGRHRHRDGLGVADRLQLKAAGDWASRHIQTTYVQYVERGSAERQPSDDGASFDQWKSSAVLLASPLAQRRE